MQEEFRCCSALTRKAHDDPAFVMILTILQEGNHAAQH